MLSRAITSIAVELKENFSSVRQNTFWNNILDHYIRITIYGHLNHLKIKKYL